MSFSKFSTNISLSTMASTHLVNDTITTVEEATSDFVEAKADRLVFLIRAISTSCQVFRERTSFDLQEHERMLNFLKALELELGDCVPSYNMLWRSGKRVDENVSQNVCWSPSEHLFSFPLPRLALKSVFLRKTTPVLPCVVVEDALMLFRSPVYDLCELFYAPMFAESSELFTHLMFELGNLITTLTEVIANQSTVFVGKSPLFPPPPTPTTLRNGLHSVYLYLCNFKIRRQHLRELGFSPVQLSPTYYWDCLMAYEQEHFTGVRVRK